MTAFLVLVCLAAQPASAAPPRTPPDLEITWVDDGHSLAGKSGETLQIRYRISNLGGTDAFAVIARASTTLGPISPARIQPGPAAGKRFERSFGLALADGMKELCVDVQLQNVALDDPPDPNLRNNRACRHVAVRDSAKEE